MYWRYLAELHSLETLTQTRDATLKALGCNTGCWLQVILATLGGTGDTCSFINVRFTVKEIKQTKNETVKLTNMKKESRDLSKEKKYFILLFGLYSVTFLSLFTLKYNCNFENHLQQNSSSPSGNNEAGRLHFPSLKGQNVLSVNSLCCVMEMSALCTAAADKLTSESPAGMKLQLKKKMMTRAGKNATFQHHTCSQVQSSEIWE